MLFRYMTESFVHLSDVFDDSSVFFPALIISFFTVKIVISFLWNFSLQIGEAAVCCSTEEVFFKYFEITRNTCLGVYF